MLRKALHKSTYCMFHLYEGLEQAKLIYGEKNQRWSTWGMWQALTGKGHKETFCSNGSILYQVGKL